MSADVFVGELDALQIARAQLFDHVAGEVGALGEQLLVGLFVVQVGQQFFAFQQIGEALGALVVQNALFVFEVAVQPLHLPFENSLERSSSSAPLREKTLQSTTVPSIPGGQ